MGSYLPVSFWISFSFCDIIAKHLQTHTDIGIQGKIEFPTSFSCKFFNLMKHAKEVIFMKVRSAYQFHSTLN